MRGGIFVELARRSDDRGRGSCIPETLLCAWLICLKNDLREGQSGQTARC